MEELIKNPYDLFSGVQETYEEALQKNTEENKSFSNIKYFRMDSAGTYPVRILPLAPIKQPDGTYTLDRKGYEYPTKTQFLKLTNPNSKSKNDKYFHVQVTHANYVGISVDLIDTYVKTAQNMYGDDASFMKKLTSSGYEGGLKWNSQRAMYIYDLNKKGDGIQLLTLSYSQYKDLEDRKLSVWKKLSSKNPKAPCPISSINGAYPVEIIRKEDNGKTSYSFNIDVIADTVSLEEKEVQELLDAPRIPEVLYRYSRYQLEATIEFLKQYDEIYSVNVMESDEIKEAIQKINLELPADDKSHFSFDKNNQKDSSKSDSDEDTLDSLWERLQDLKQRGIDDKSEEGQELRDRVRKFIDKHCLTVRVLRTRSNEDMLGLIEDEMQNSASKSDDDDSERYNDSSDDESAGQENESDDEVMLESRRKERPSVPRTHI